MKTYLSSLVFAALSLNVYAGYDLALNGKKVTCYAEDNQTVELNAKRTTIKYTVEGESQGAQKITKFDHDEGVLACYTTAELMLCLNDGGDGDVVGFEGDSEATAVYCE